MTPRQRARRLQLAAAVLVALAVTGGGVAVLVGVKAAERDAYAAYATGSPCQAVGAPPAFARSAKLKRIVIGEASFHFLRGDADCTVLRPGLMKGDEERPVCRFDHPGYVEVNAPGGEGRYVIPFGQASLVVEPRGPRCVIQPSA